KQQYPQPCGGSNPCPFCKDVPARDTWYQHLPSGYIYKNVWQPLHCRPYDYHVYQCFRDIE
ncbi:hypothetical protein PoB_001299000, partial [Plakobranchus ocellatus]